MENIAPSTGMIDVSGVYNNLMQIRKQIQDTQQAEQQQAAAQYAAEMSRQAFAQDAALAAEYERNPSAFARPAQPAPQQQAAPSQEQSMYGADVYEQQRKAIQQGKEYGLAKMSKMNVNEQQYKQGKDFLDTHYGPDMKPFIESDQYKNAQLVARENVTTTQANMLSNLGKTIKSIELIEPPKGTPEQKYEEEKRRLQSGQIKTFLTQLVNSAKGSADAEQANEFLRRSPEVVNLPEYQALMGKGLMNAAGLMAFLQSREGSTLKAKMADALSTNPQAYLQKAKLIHNDLADTYNDRMFNQVVAPTSPNIAERHFGIKPVTKFDVGTQAQVPADVAVVRPTAAPAAVAGSISRDAIMAELERRKAAKSTQQSTPATAQSPAQDFTGKSAF
jgi:hypothetical protein